MKKHNSIFLISSLVLLIILLTGCNSNSKTVDELFKVLQKQNIIEKDLKLIDTVYKVFGGPVPGGDTKSYIYEDNNSNLIAIHYETTHDEDNPYYVIIYRNVTAKTVEFVDISDATDLFYKYSDGKVSKKDKYGLDEVQGEKYNITYTKGIFGKKYKVIRDKENY